MANVFSFFSQGAQSTDRRKFWTVGVVLVASMFLALDKGIATTRDGDGDVTWSKAQQRLIKAVQQRPTADGATVAEVLAYAERERPHWFKVSELQVQYDPSGSTPEAVTINYWIGSNRKRNDSYVDLSYALNPKGQVQPIPRSAMTLRALETGKQAFVQQIDAIYAMTCKPFPESQAKC
jgi:hypothetical protein